MSPLYAAATVVEVWLRTTCRGILKSTAASAGGAVSHEAICIALCQFWSSHSPVDWDCGVAVAVRLAVMLWVPIRWNCDSMLGEQA